MEEKETIVIDVQLDANGVANQLAQVNEQIAAVKAQNAALRKEVKDGTKTWADVSGQLAVNEQRLKTLTTAQKSLTAQFNAQVGTNLRLGDSLKEMGAELTALKNAYRSLSKAERDSDAGKELLKRIQELDAEMKAADASMGDFQRNVGNYPGAMQPLQDQLAQLTQNLEDLRKENKEGTEEFATIEKQIEETNAAIAQLNSTVDGAVQEMAPLKQQIKDATNELLQMRMRGEENTEQYQQMLEHLGKLKDTMMDAQAEIKQMASDTGALNSVLDGAKAAAGGFSVALGVMTLVGDKDSETAKELAEAQAKLQSAIAITTGLQAVQNALQKESAFMMGVNKIKMLAAAAAQKVYAAATRDAEAAQAVFNRVAKSNIYVWLAGVILTVVGAIAAFTRGSKEQAEQVEQVNRTLNNQAEILQRLTQGYADINRRVEDNMEAAIENARAQGKSTEEIRQMEDALFKKKKERMDQEKKDYEWLNDNLVTYENKYSDTMSKIRALDAQYMDALRQGNTERAAFYLDEINKLGEVADAIKKRLDAVNDFNSRYGQLLRERQAQIDQRNKEDEDAARQEAEDAKRRHEQRIEQIKREREETKKAFDEMMANLKTAEQLADQRVADNKTIADNVRNALDHIGLLETAVSELPLKPFEPLTEGLAEVAGAAPSALDQFSASFQENAQAIMETSAALESSFSSVASMYKTMAQDESKSEAERAKAASRAKAWSKIQIATNAGAAVAKGVATAVDVGFPAAIPAIATMTATILSAIAQAKSLLNEAYESGGVIGGYHGVSMGHDNTAIIARRGEMVLNANQQKQLFEIANGGSKAGGMYSALAEALRSMPAPVLVYSEFQDFTNKVATLDEAAKLR